MPFSKLICFLLATCLGEGTLIQQGDFPRVCPPCNLEVCRPVVSCRGGITWDDCGCCEVCAKTLGEECGGPYGAYGKCGLGLTCLKDSRECPYLFHPNDAMGTEASDECRKYLFNAIGRCVQEHRLRIRGFSLLKG